MPLHQILGVVYSNRPVRLRATYGLVLAPAEPAPYRLPNHASRSLARALSLSLWRANGEHVFDMIPAGRHKHICMDLRADACTQRAGSDLTTRPPAPGKPGLACWPAAQRGCVADHVMSSFVNVTATWAAYFDFNLYYYNSRRCSYSACTARMYLLALLSNDIDRSAWTYGLFSPKKKKSNKLEYVIWNSLAQAASKRNSFSSMRSTIHESSKFSPFIYLFIYLFIWKVPFSLFI